MNTVLYQTVTNTIVAAIESGSDTWQMPWNNAVSLPENALTENAYRGVNILSLWASAQIQGFSASHWASYKQWSQLGAFVRKGERGTPIIFYSEFEVEGEKGVEKAVMAKSSFVFNACQVENYDPGFESETDLIDKIGGCESFVARTGAEIRIGGSQAFYKKSEDYIQMPAKSLFVGTPTSNPTESWYATLFHELTHWTGPETRIGREMGRRFGDQAYAAEELTAELGSAFLCAMLGVSPVPREDHAGYISSWLTLLKGDSKAIFFAAARAQEAVDYLHRL